MNNDLEIRIRRTERAISDLESRLGSLSWDAGKVQQQIVSFRSAWNNSGSASSATGSTVNVAVVRSCDNAPIAGAAVQATQAGAVAAQGVTNSAGMATLVLATPGSTTINASASGFAGGTATVSAPAGGSAAAFITLSADVNHVCCSNCPTLMPATLHLTDVIGTLQLAWNAAASAWEGCRTLTLPCSAAGPGGVGCNSVGMGTVGQVYQLFCGGQYAAFTLVMSYMGCLDGGSGLFQTPYISVCSSPPVQGNCQESHAPISSSCNPVNFTYQFGNTFLYGPNGSSVVITN